MLSAKIGYFRAAFDPAAAAYIAAVEAADGQALEAAVRTAINSFVVGCKTDGIWSSIAASCILMGARTLSGAITPLTGSAPTNNNFVSGDYDRKLGLRGDGSTKYLVANRLASADAAGSAHQSMYVTQLETRTFTSLIGYGGFQVTGSAAMTSSAAASQIAFYTKNNGSDNRGGANQSTGFKGWSKSGNANTYRWDSANVAGSGNTGQTSPAISQCVYATLNASSAVTSVSNQRLSFYSMGGAVDLGLLDSRVSGLYADIGYAIDNPTAPLGALHPEARDWVRRVYLNGGTVSASTAAAVNTFCRDIDAAGIRDRFLRLNLFCGSNLAAALVPLYRGTSLGGTQLGGTTDTNVNFVAGDYNETGSSSGLNGNGSTKYLNTGLAVSNITASNAHFGVGLRSISDTTSFRTLMGSWNGLASGTTPRIYQLAGRRADANRNCIFGNLNTAAATGRFFGDSVNNANLATGDIVAAWPTMYRNGTASGTSATGSDDYASSHNIFVFALNNAGTSVVDYTNSRLNWYSAGLSMTSAQVSAFNTALANFSTALSRT